MHETNLITYLHGQAVEEGIRLTRVEFCRACGIPEEHLSNWVFEGVIEPIGQSPQEWQFDGTSLRRARVALRLTHDLEVNLAGVALALDLLDQIDELRARLKRRASF